MVLVASSFQHERRLVDRVVLVNSVERTDPVCCHRVERRGHLVQVEARNVVVFGERCGTDVDERFDRWWNRQHREWSAALGEWYTDVQQRCVVTALTRIGSTSKGHLL
jgi:hypothetical protein